jgi:hypothetical protein
MLISFVSFVKYYFKKILNKYIINIIIIIIYININTLINISYYIMIFRDCRA